MNLPGCCVFLLSLALLLNVSTAQDKNPTVTELLNSLQSAITDAVKALKDKKTDDGTSLRGNETLAYMPQAVSAIRQSIARGDTNSAQQSLNQIQIMLPDPKIADLCTKLLVEIEKDSLAREKTYLDSVDSSVEKAVAAAFKAKEPKELDAPILELSRLSQRTESNYNSSQLTQRSSEKARSAVTFLCRWQDYLMQIKSGNIGAANSILKNLTENNSAYPFIPRSEILNRMKPGEDSSTESSNALPKMEGKTLKDLKIIRDETENLLQKQPNSQPLRQFLQNLNNFERARQQQQSGLIGQTYTYCVNRDYNGTDDFVGLKQELLLEILPTYLDVKESYPHKAGESPVDYLQRISKESRAKSDWQTVWKSLETYKNVAFSNGQAPTWLTADVQGLSYFIVAQNQEKAGQFSDAVRSYKRIIALNGQNLPITETTQRLAALEKEHPEDFAKGSEVISPYTSGRTVVPNPIR